MRQDFFTVSIILASQEGSCRFNSSPYKLASVLMLKLEPCSHIRMSMSSDALVSFRPPRFPTMRVPPARLRHACCDLHALRVAGARAAQCSSWCPRCSVGSWRLASTCKQLAPSRRFTAASHTSPNSQEIKGGSITRFLTNHTQKCPNVTPGN